MKFIDIVWIVDIVAPLLEENVTLFINLYARSGNSMKAFVLQNHKNFVTREKKNRSWWCQIILFDEIIKTLAE